MTSWQATTFLTGEYVAARGSEPDLHQRRRRDLAAPEHRAQLGGAQAGDHKMRGQATLPGLHTFRIGADGISIFAPAPPGRAAPSLRRSSPAPQSRPGWRTSACAASTPPGAGGGARPDPLRGASLVIRDAAGAGGDPIEQERVADRAGEAGGVEVILDEEVAGAANACPSARSWKRIRSILSAPSSTRAAAQLEHSRTALAIPLAWISPPTCRVAACRSKTRGALLNGA